MLQLTVFVVCIVGSLATGCYVASDKGAGYRGLVNQTRNGHKCQNWASQTPQEHSRTPENYPNSGLVDNYCRNPDDSGSPWCYTTNPGVRWEYCDVPQCEECYDTNDSGASYRGKLAQTKTGLICQAWASQSPHEHTRTPQKYPDAGLDSNYCRNPDGSGLPWCYTTSSRRWEFCEIPTCPVDCYNKLNSGAQYRGTVSVTEGGLTCQEWASQSPHEHDRTTVKYPSAGLQSNYCRNPDGSKRPWCYTTNSGTRWQYCDIPVCSDCYVASNKGRGYRGNVAVTKSGRHCQSWSSQTPHEHSRTPENYPNEGLIKNHCRNPDNTAAPWCYTTDPSSRWEFCNIPKCKECYDPNDSGASYRGDVAQSRSGYKCQAWTSQSPHEHSRTPQNYPLSGLASNYCRNPDGESAPWCYTTNSAVRWEFCSIPVCPSNCYDTADSGSTYRGTVAQTESGLQCQRWDSQSPHKHSRTTQNYPNSGLRSNFCRNPDGSARPWCYTIDSSVRWQCCDITKCDE